MNKGQFSIDGIIYNPMSINQTMESLATEDSGRTDDGVMHIQWVKQKYRKWEIEMPPCSSDVASSILSKVQGQIYNITIFDITTNNFVTVNVYTPNSKGECYSGVVNNGIWQGISFSAIEMAGV